MTIAVCLWVFFFFEARVKSLVHKKKKRVQRTESAVHDYTGGKKIGEVRV